MAHPCIFCGSECYCNGDIDDVIVSHTPSNCESCGCEDDYEDDDEGGDFDESDLDEEDDWDDDDYDVDIDVNDDAEQSKQS